LSANTNIEWCGSRAKYEDVTLDMDRGIEEAICRPLQLKDSKGGDMSEWPEDLRVREFPR